MACYESEEGVITLSNKNYNLLLLILKSKYNQEQVNLYNLSLELYNKIKNNTDKSLDNILSENPTAILSEIYRKECFITNGFDPKYFKSENKFQIFKPRKKAFLPLNNRVKSFTFELDENDSGSIQMDFETKKVTWSVLYCNGKVRKHRETGYGALFHDFLKCATLSKKEIYCVYYENEYENECE